MPGIPADRVHSAEFWKLAEELLARGKLQTHPVRVLPGGLAGVAEGLKMQKEWRVSGEKLVYVIGKWCFFLLVLRMEGE